MTPATPEIERHTDAGHLAEAVAAALLDLVEEIQAGGAVPSICLTGGTIADAIHRQIPRLTSARTIDWARVELWWGDERFLPAGDAERNADQARTGWLDHVDLDPARVHQIPAREVGTSDVTAVAATYAATVRQHAHAPFDLVMLGIGPDGHVASLFPGYPQLDVVEVEAVAVTDSPKPPPERISLTYPALNRNRQVWFLASGEGKADAVARALRGADRHEIPAVGVQGGERTVWWLDEGAASGL